MSAASAPRQLASRGFTVIELLIATALSAAAIVGFLRLATTAERAARAQPAAADMYQRLRVAADMLQRDLLAAGAGLVHGADAAPLVNYLPPVMPMRTGARHADPELSFFSDRITLLSASERAYAAPLLTDMAAPGVDVPINAAAPGCPSAGLCGFADNTRALIVDTSGAGLGFDLFSVAGAGPGLAHGSPDPEFSRAYAKGSARVMPIRQRVYYLHAATRRLMVYDGAETDVPLAENIVALRFEYFLDPAADSAPRPPEHVASCVYGAGAPPLPQLGDLGAAARLPATPAMLTDGPSCGLTPHRFDGDLLRVRRIRVTIRAEVSDASLRGGGADFASPGASPGGASAVPDIAVTLDVTPRNLQPTR